MILPKGFGINRGCLSIFEFFCTQKRYVYVKKSTVVRIYTSIEDLYIFLCRKNWKITRSTLTVPKRKTREILIPVTNRARIFFIEYHHWNVENFYMVIEIVRCGTKDKKTECDNIFIAKSKIIENDFV